MKIDTYVSDFVKADKRNRYSYTKRISDDILLGKNPYSLVNQFGYDESEYLQENIRNSVQAYTRNKDAAIEVYKMFVRFLEEKDVAVDIVFPPISVSSSFERQMFIAKYLQTPGHHISDLQGILWVGQRTIEDDISRLRGNDPIQINGRPFCIPDTERKNNTIQFTSTAHPIFLAENLTQVLVMLEGLRTISENPLYTNYAMLTASNIWSQLSQYAKDRINKVVSEINTEFGKWVKTLSEYKHETFMLEQSCVNVRNNGASAVLDSYKNGHSFCMEYNDSGHIVILDNCVVIPRSLHGNSVQIHSGEYVMEISLDDIIRSASTLEELAAN